MTKLIDKDALVEEIKRRIKNTTQEMNKFFYASNYKEWKSEVNAYKSLISYIDTLEIKEVDLDKEIDSVEDKYYGFESLSRADIIDIANYFFKLGLKTKQV